MAERCVGYPIPDHPDRVFDAATPPLHFARRGIAGPATGLTMIVAPPPICLLLTASEIRKVLISFPSFLEPVTVSAFFCIVPVPILSAVVVVIALVSVTIISVMVVADTAVLNIPLSLDR